MNDIEAIARALRDTNIGTESDPCKLHSWLTALFAPPSYPLEHERQEAERLADDAINTIARAALACITERWMEPTAAMEGEGWLAIPSLNDVQPADMHPVWQAMLRVKAKEVDDG